MQNEQYTVTANGKVFRLTDFESEWRIPQANAMARYLRHATQGVDFTESASAIMQLFGNLAEEELTQEVLAVLLIPINEKKWDSARYKEYAKDLEDLTPTQAIEVFSRFFTGIKVLEAVGIQTSSTAAIPDQPSTESGS